MNCRVFVPTGRVASYCMRGFHAIMREADTTRSGRSRDEFKFKISQNLNKYPR